MPTATADAVAAQFQRDGFVILENAFSETELDPISEEIQRVIDGRVEYVPDSDRIYEPGSDPPRLRNAFRLHQYNPFFLDVARHPPVVEVMETLLGAPLRLYGSQLFAKPARVGTAVPLHQDMPYWPFDPPELISAWIALDDSSVANGCVRFVPGSHRLGMLPHAPSGVKGNSLGLTPHAHIEALGEVAVEVRRGSVVLHHCLTAHRSEPNSSEQMRRGLIYVYMSPQVRLTDPSKMKGAIDFPVIHHAAS
jgi:phytanoyl-CoA hydroxylase